jgi:hypothetical protein
MKCVFCQKPMNNALEKHIKACNNCTVLLLMKKHNLTIRKPKAITLNTKKFNKE